MSGDAYTGWRCDGCGGTLRYEGDHCRCGLTQPVTRSSQGRCPECDGKGRYIATDPPGNCGNCNGSGLATAVRSMGPACLECLPGETCANCPPSTAGPDMLMALAARQFDPYATRADIRALKQERRQRAMRRQYTSPGREMSGAECRSIVEALRTGDEPPEDTGQVIYRHVVQRYRWVGP